MIYARSAFPKNLDGSAFVALQPPLALPFQLASRAASTSVPVKTVLRIAEQLDLTGASQTDVSVGT